ncbi:MAG: hypothetical protein ACK5A9_06525, partial [Pseudanabaena sp.]
ELRLYDILLKEKYSSETKADRLVETVCDAHNKLNHVTLSKEKFNLIKEISAKFDIEQFLSVFPILPSPLNLDLAGFSQVYEFQYVQPKAILKHQTGVVHNIPKLS